MTQIGLVPRLGLFPYISVLNNDGFDVVCSTRREGEVHDIQGYGCQSILPMLAGNNCSVCLF